MELASIMQTRGPILLIFGASLVLSPLAINMATTRQAAETAPAMIVTDGAADAACDAQAVEARSYRLGCVRSVERLSTRRTTAGGAVFISSR